MMSYVRVVDIYVKTKHRWKQGVASLCTGPLSVSNVSMLILLPAECTTLRPATITTGASCPSGTRLRPPPYRCTLVDVWPLLHRKRRSCSTRIPGTYIPLPSVLCIRKLHTCEQSQTVYLTFVDEALHLAIVGPIAWLRGHYQQR